MMNDDINNYIPSVLNPRAIRKENTGNSTFLTQNSIISRCSLSLKRNGVSFTPQKKAFTQNKENLQSNINALDISTLQHSRPAKTHDKSESSSGFSAIKDFVDQFDNRHRENQGKEVNTLNTIPQTKTLDNSAWSSSALSAIKGLAENYDARTYQSVTPESPLRSLNTILQDQRVKECDSSIISLSSATELNETEDNSSFSHTINEACKPLISVSFGINKCNKVNISSKKSNIKNISVCHENENITVDCDITEISEEASVVSDLDENMNQNSTVNPLKRSAVSVSLEIKKKKPLTAEDIEGSGKVLLLKTDAIDQVSHVIVQPPNYTIVKRQYKSKNSSKNKSVCNNAKTHIKLSADKRQKSIDSYFKKKTDADVIELSDTTILLEDIADKNEDLSHGESVKHDAVDMSKNSGLNGANRASSSNHRSPRNEVTSQKRFTRQVASPTRKISQENGEHCRKQQETKALISQPQSLNSPVSRQNSARCQSSKTLDALHFSLPSKSKINNKPRSVPYHKVVTGTHFAVDAFSYGDIPNVKHYFLTHFHSDHYMGLKKTFNKPLYCSKITADLCISRLGVNSDYINILHLDEPLRIDGVEVTAVDANHCPGSIMLVFTLPGGRTLLHTGDFRATPAMESYPLFWNRDVHTVYLDTTYCNPRYDFPTQDQSLDMALFLLRQKKIDLEKIGKKFSSVLIVCGTYTIGKEKFFQGMSRRVGCTVWACPEKDKVLQIVEGRSFSQVAPQSCQLHVVPMRDLTVEKLRSYLDSQNGAFDEVVAFKPSGWENGKNSTVHKDKITIYGIPYSEHSSFSEMIRFVNFLKPKQVIPTVDISGGPKAVQKYFPCPLVYKEEVHSQSKVTDYFRIPSKQQGTAVTW